MLSCHPGLVLSARTEVKQKREERQRERGDALQENLSSRKRERAEVAPPPPVSQSVIQSNGSAAQQLCKVCVYVNYHNVTVKCVSQPSRATDR